MDTTLAYAQQQDAKDPLRQYRDQFYFPKAHNGHECLYFCGNSLGLQPKGVEAALQAELEHWRDYAVEGHFKGDMPWMEYHKFLEAQAAEVVGAKPSEVVVMNTLTTNLHLMMVSFYRPTKQRYKIVMEGGAFPSDQYAVETQAKFHGYDPDTAIVEVHPRQGEHTLRSNDIVQAIHDHGDTVALVMFGGVNYYTGQWYDMEAITKAARQVGANVGFDLAHAVGNVPVQLHDLGCDFAVWCSYKYLNSGPGGPSGVFVHEQHAHNRELPRFAGWWGHDEASRFRMEKGFEPMPGAAGWQLSNAQILSFAAHKVALDQFSEVGMSALREKGLALSRYLRYLLEAQANSKVQFEIITPEADADRGNQLSILTSGGQGKALFEYLQAHNAIGDWREPNVIRLATAPLYNSYEDVWRFAELVQRF